MFRACLEARVQYLAGAIRKTQSNLIPRPRSEPGNFRQHFKKPYGGVSLLRRTEYTWTDDKTNAQIAKELKITSILDKLMEYKRSWIQHVNRMPRNRLPRIMKYYCPAGRRNHGRPLKRLLDS